MIRALLLIVAVALGSCTNASQTTKPLPPCHNGGVAPECNP